MARTTSDPSSSAGAIVREIRAVDGSVPICDIRTMRDRMQDSLARQRFSTIMLVRQGLSLAGIGILLPGDADPGVDCSAGLFSPGPPLAMIALREE